jgi:hypothetical protein
MGEEERENEGALTDRDRALEDWRTVYQGVATTLSGLYRLAGREDLAERMRSVHGSTAPSGLDRLRAVTTFRERLVATLRAIEPILEVEGVMVVGSEVPNLLEPNAASTLVVSLDVDVLVPLPKHAAVASKLAAIHGLRPSAEEPSVWLPESEPMIEVNFLGQDPELRDPSESYPFPDDVLTLMVFGALGWLSPATPVTVEGVRVPLPRPAGLLIEKLATDRTGIKGDRDLLVALGLLVLSSDADLEEARRLYETLSVETRHAVRSNLSILALLPPRPGVPDPTAHRGRVAAFLTSLTEVQ